MKSPFLFDFQTLLKIILNKSKHLKSMVNTPSELSTDQPQTSSSRLILFLAISCYIISVSVQISHCGWLGMEGIQHIIYKGNLAWTGIIKKLCHNMGSFICSLMFYVCNNPTKKDTHLISHNKLSSHAQYRKKILLLKSAFTLFHTLLVAWE